MSNQLINRYFKTARDIKQDRTQAEDNGENWQMSDRQQQKLTNAALKAKPQIQNYIEQSNREAYPKYGSEVAARFAYDTGSRDLEAVQGHAFHWEPNKISGKTTHVIGRQNGNEFDSIDSQYTTHYDGGQTSQHFSGRNEQGQEWNYHTYNLEDGGTYSFGDDARRGSGEFETYTPGQVDYGKKLGMNKVEAPKPTLVPRRTI